MVVSIRYSTIKKKEATRIDLTPERSIDLCLQTFPKLLLLLVPKVTTRSLCPECIANLKLPIDAFYQKVVQPEIERTALPILSK
jgi:hypothetical protein